MTLVLRVRQAFLEEMCSIIRCQRQNGNFVMADFFARCFFSFVVRFFRRIVK